MLLRYRLAIGASLIMFALLLLVLWFVHAWLEGHLVAHLDEELTIQARVVLEEVTEAPDGKFTAGASVSLGLDSGGSSAFAYNAGQLVWQRVEAGTPQPFNPGFLTSSATTQVVSQDAWRIIGLRRGPFVVQVGHPLKAIHGTLKSLDEAAIFGGLIATVLAGVLLTLMMTLAARPFNHLVERIEHLEGNAPIPNTQRMDEIGRIARALETSLQKLRGSRQRETRFLADASHELRTPVTALITDLEYSLSQPRSPEEDRAALRRALRTATHMRDLAANLLALTRAQSVDTTPITRQPLDLLALAEDAVDRLMPLAVQKGLEVVIEGEEATLQGDATLLSRLIENLLGNAIKYTQHGQVTLEVRPDADNIWIQVRDTGPGMSPETLERLSEPYARGNVLHPDSFGLGLAVVESIVAAHGGHIEAESLVGTGTRILVRLPKSGTPNTPPTAVGAPS